MREREGARERGRGRKRKRGPWVSALSFFVSARISVQSGWWRPWATEVTRRVCSARCCASSWQQQHTNIPTMLTTAAATTTPTATTREGDCLPATWLELATLLPGLPRWAKSDGCLECVKRRESRNRTAHVPRQERDRQEGERCCR